MPLDTQLLTAALRGYEHQRTEIQEKIAAIHRRLRTGGKTRAVGGGADGVRRTMSAAARKKIAAAQKKRWAAYHKSKA